LALLSGDWARIYRDEEKKRTRNQRRVEQVRFHFESSKDRDDADFRRRLKNIS